MRTGQLVVILGTVAVTACARLGFSDRVLWRVRSPDGQIVAVCQEVPVFDGPDYDVRLERPDGTLLRPLYRIGDGDPCSEVTWSPDGRTLAVLSGHVARIRLVDVRWALDHPAAETAYWSWRQVDLSTERRWVSGRNIRFATSRTIELQLCPGRPNQTEQDCASAVSTHRLEVPSRIVTGH